jgi:hypothetical protein
MQAIVSNGYQHQRRQQYNNGRDRWKTMESSHMYVLPYTCTEKHNCARRALAMLFIQEEVVQVREREEGSKSSRHRPLPPRRADDRDVSEPPPSLLTKSRPVLPVLLLRWCLSVDRTVIVRKFKCTPKHPQLNEAGPGSR